MLAPPLDSLTQRQRVVAWAVALTTGTPLAPQRYERSLLDLYQQGSLTLDQVEELLECSVYQVLYHSRATEPPNETQLQALLAQSRTYNGAHQITGLLLYSDQCFVQVLEGPAPPVQALYARIQHDPRHEQVVTVRQGPSPQRRFADWRMGFGVVDEPAVAQVLDELHPTSPLGQELPVEVPHLRALLATLGPQP